MFKLPDNLEELKTSSEIFKNLFEGLAVMLGVAGLWKWLAERKDRATDILLQLERKFCEPEIVQGRQCIEDKERYDLIKDRLKQYVVESRAERSKLAAESSKEKRKCESTQEEKILDDCRAIDALLRFYVVLCGVRHARQVQNLSLSTCFRYWLSHYYNPDRTEYKEYVDEFFPTLRKWLAKDAEQKHEFFHPRDFGWPET